MIVRSFCLKKNFDGETYGCGGVTTPISGC